ncbi:MAG: ABC transporter ATP-binding protein [Verrucomicrobiota bacterium]
MTGAILTANFRKQFPGGPEIVADNLRFSGGITVLFGASGSGKTTILRCLAGLETPDDGEITLGDEVWFKKIRKILLPPRKRGVGFVPQDYALFPHLTIAGNVGYGLNDLPATERAARVVETLRWLGLNGLENRWPRELSGGQQQRVALARAVVRRPKLLLLDEPLAALDTPTRLRLRGELRQLLRRLGLPTILVTHDRFEALAVGDRMVVMADGRNQQSGPVPEVFNRPANLAVAHIAGTETVLPARVLKVADGIVTVAVGDMKLVAVAAGFPTEVGEAHVCIRADEVMLVADALPEASARNRFSATVVAVERDGPLLRVDLDCGFPLKALLTPQAAAEMKLHPRAAVGVLIKAPQIHLIPLAR